MKRLILPILLLSVFQMKGQDMSFSQYASSPLSFNPANTGLIQGAWRAAANYSNEWNGYTSPFMNTSLSYDMNLLKGRLKRSSIGVGIQRTDRVAGDGKEEVRRTGISVAYHKLLNRDVDRPSTLSIGLQSMLVQKNGEITIPSFGGTQVAEMHLYELDPYLDFNAGLMYSAYICKRLSVYGGVGYYHFTKPVETFLGDDYKLRSRISTQLGGAYTFNKSWKLFVSSFYQQQGKEYDVLTGAVLAYNLRAQESTEQKQLTAYLGAWHKYKTIIVPYLGLEWNGFRLGLSSDLNVNTIPNESSLNTFELSLIYNGGSNPNTFMSNNSIPSF